MVRISTLITAAAVGFSYVDALPTNPFGLSGLGGGVRGEIAKREVVLSTLPDGIKAVTGNGAVPLRLDFNDFIKDDTRKNLYLLALSRMMQTSQSDPTSHYQIAGIHGRPYVAWDGVRGGNNDGGYCTHADILFLSWHRPYLALYEGSLHAHVQKIAKEFKAGTEDSTKALAAAQDWRMPYWDWATNATIPELIGNTPRVTVRMPNGQDETIDNPLYSYKYNFANAQTQKNELPSQPFSTAKQTTRVSIDTLNAQLANIGSNLRDRVYNLLADTGYANFARFSNKGTTTAVNGKLDSLESVHDVIHATVGGGNGEMGWVDYAAHDPLFFLHHTNIDRIFAMWQAVNRDNADAYLKPNDDFTSTYGTYAIQRGSKINSNTPLPPFRKASGANYYSSEDVKSTKSFGYAYPETMDWERDAGDFVAWAKEQVNIKYGKGAPPGVLTSVSSATNSMSSTSSSRTTTTSSRVTTTSRTTTTSSRPTTTSIRPSTTPARTTTTSARATTTSARPTTTPSTTSARPATTSSTTTTTSRTTSSTAAPAPPAPTTTRPATTRPATTSSAAPVPSSPVQGGTRPPRGQRTCSNTPWYLWFWSGLWDCFFEARRQHQNQHQNQHQKRFDLGDIADIAGDVVNTVATVVENAIDRIPDVKDLIDHASSLISGDQYTEYVAQIKAENNALDGTFTVYVFIGDYDKDPKTWPLSKNLVGQHSAFTNIGGGHHFTGAGTVPLTSAIINLVANEKVANLGRAAVVPYLRDNLHWEVATANGEAVPSKDVENLKVGIFSSDVKLPCVDGSLPLWGNTKPEYEITQGRPGGLCQGENIV
ncbi:uncharacterized protein DFL_008127 [Arthrobotrys flagrans]|uniref:tyrosinase n=1 Tax=Arthrobotrys flagrans TaxID=97331 RepID=A0A436ZMY2_ARTFL|nr:hypothetical protein DFL_008127 [Arthrobotrys flagrans]